MYILCVGRDPVEREDVGSKLLSLLGTFQSSILDAGHVKGGNKPKSFNSSGPSKFKSRNTMDWP